MSHAIAEELHTGFCLMNDIYVQICMTQALKMFYMEATILLFIPVYPFIDHFIAGLKGQNRHTCSFSQGVYMLRVVLISTAVKFFFRVVINFFSCTLVNNLPCEQLAKFQRKASIAQIFNE